MEEQRLCLADLLVEYAAAEAHQEPLPSATLPLITAPEVKASNKLRSALLLLRRDREVNRSEGRLELARLPEMPGIAPQSQWAHWVFFREQTVALGGAAEKSRLRSPEYWSRPFHVV
ncbi:MAG: hypothetical protein JO336_02155 [Acidobacteriia bacterium]|nr:hypothetical protein [Terriglobia bacterium]MBV8905746.1 hypothetical protein [Terriglobia bacterium]